MYNTYVEVSANKLPCLIQLFAIDVMQMPQTDSVFQTSKNSNHEYK